MDKVLQFLQETKTFFMATEEGSQPRVRPFGFVMEYKGKLCFTTGNQKPIFRQMKENPQVELCACTPEGRWLRLAGTVSFVPEVEAKEKAFEVMPALKNIYSLDDGVFEIFEMQNCKGSISSMTGEYEELAF